MRITVNGEQQDVPAGTTVAELVQRLGLPRRGLAVERNLQIVPHTSHASCVLCDGDALEIVTLVGGG